MEVYCDLQNVPDDLPLAAYDGLYHDQNRNSRTEITTVFFSLQNLNWLNEEIGLQTGRMLNRNVKILPNNLFFVYLETVLRGVANLPFVSQVIHRLNNVIIEHEVQVQYQALRRRELFFKWFFFKDRPRVLSRSVLTNGRFRYEGISTAQYALEDPDKNRWDDFQRDQKNRKCSRTIPKMFSPFYIS
jgi:hypothetical protein